MEWSTITCFHMTIKLRGWKRHFRKCHWWVACETCGTCGSTHWTRFRGTWYMCIHHLWSTRTPWNKWSTTVRCGQQQPHSPTGMVITMTEDSCWMNARCSWGRKKISKPICLKIQRVMSSLYQFIIVYSFVPDVSRCCKCLQSNNIHFDFGFSTLRLCSAALQCLTSFHWAPGDWRLRKRWSAWSPTTKSSPLLCRRQNSCINCSMMQYAVLCSTRMLQYVLFMLCFVWDPIVFFIAHVIFKGDPMRYCHC